MGDLNSSTAKTVNGVELLQALQAKIYNLLTTGGEFTKPSEDNFFCWVTPGMPVNEDDFLFASEGLHGVVRSNVKVDEPEKSELESTKIRNHALEQIRAKIGSNLSKEFVAKTKEITDAQRAEANAEKKKEKSKEQFLYDLALARKRVPAAKEKLANAKSDLASANEQLATASAELTKISSGDSKDEAVKSAKESKENAEKKVYLAERNVKSCQEKLDAEQSRLDELEARKEAEGCTEEELKTENIEVKEEDIEAVIEAVATAASEHAAEPAQPALTAEEIEALRADDSYRKYMQAEDFANLVDFIPDLATRKDDGASTLTVMYNEGSLSDRYKYALRMSKVMHGELDEKTKAKINKFRSLLTVETEKTDIITDEKTVVIEPSPMVKLYNEKMEAYSNAVIEYNNIKIAGLAAKKQEDVHNWALNGKAYYNKVKAAEADWVNNGYKNEYEQISAFINQKMQSDMVMLKEEYKDVYEKAVLSGFGSDFLWTTLSPANFAKSKGWTKFTFSSSDYHDSDKELVRNHSVTVQGSAGVRIGRLRIGGGGGSHTESNHQENTAEFDLSTFTMSFEICQVQIVRPWFKTAFLNSKYWCFDDNNVITKGQMLSNGGNPPSGMLPAYPTAIIFVRNLVFDFGNENSKRSFMHNYYEKNKFGGGGVSFGPFHIGARRTTKDSSSQDVSENTFHEEGSSLVVDGMQIIGYNCHVLNTPVPDPNPDITEWV